jgi:peptidyl-prolyl cis-trans isomerase D
MLGFFRKLAGTWPARIFFLALAAAFVGWGVSSKVNLTGGDADSVATVGGKSISAQDFNQAFRADLQRVAKRYPDPTQIPPDVRQTVASQALERLITQQAMDIEAKHMGLAAPDAAVQDEIRAMPAFQGMDGNFDHNQYLQVLNQNNLTPQRFQDEIRMDVAKNQILKTVVAGATPSDMLVNLVYGYLYQTRTSDLVSFPFKTYPLPAAPADAVLQRYAANNVAHYTSPEYRRIKAVVLSPATIGRGLNLSDADLHAWFEAHKSEFQSPEKRSLQVITTGTKETAQALADPWKAGATWDAMQASAKAKGATSTELDNTTQAAIPAPELAQASFAALVDSVTGPIAEPLGYQVVRVTSVTPAKHPTYADLATTVRSRLGEERAGDLIDERAQKLQDLFAGGSHIDEVPAEIGAAGAEGTLDAQGNKQDGGKAPIPAPDAVRALMIADAFKAAKSDTTQLVEGPDHVWYAVAVQDIIKPEVKPFETIRAQVLADWQAAQVRKQSEIDATKLMTLVNGGQPIATAAWGSGHQVQRTPPMTRNKAIHGVPVELVQVIFTLKKGQATMVETNEGFLVAGLAQITQPDPKSDPSAVADVRRGLTQALQDDMLASYVSAVSETMRYGVNTKVFQQVTKSQGE